jgi:hypothetical protein
MIPARGLGYDFTVNMGGGHPSQISAFSSGVSVLHVATGFLAGLFPGFEAAALGAFTAYQLGQVPTGQTWQSTAGDILEFAIGLVLAHLCGAAFLKAVR